MEYLKTMLRGTIKLVFPDCPGCSDWDEVRLRVTDHLLGLLNQAEREGKIGITRPETLLCVRSGKNIKENVVIWRRKGNVRAIQERASPFAVSDLLRVDR